MHRMIVPAFRAALATVCLMVSAQPTVAQEAFPAKNLHVIVGQGAGGGMDTLARLLAEQMSQGLGRTVVVENRTGAGGAIGTEYVAKAAPDGHTLLLAPIGNMVFSPILTPGLRYSALEDFEPVSMLATFPLVVLVKSDLPVSNLAELIDYLRKNPRLANYGGSGPAFQFASEMFKLRAGVPGEFIQYRSMSETITAIASGDLAMAMVDTGPAITGLSGGRVKALAVTAAERLPGLPDVPTVSELGLPGLEVEYWAGVFAPSGTPPERIQRLEASVLEALRTDKVKERLQSLNLTPVFGGKAQLSKVLAEDTKKWAEVAERANIQVNQ